jgi:dGTPase
MKNKDKWSRLLGEMRFREKTPTIPTDGRNPFENDYGRLISSAPIRRLQDKTQVFPLEQSDFIRTRLTHSLEVSYIASSIGQSIEKILIDYGDVTYDQKGFLSSLLRVSGLIHDLGNPPFGHFGEEAVKKFFNDYFRDYTEKDLSKDEIEDFKNFDGNVQTFRILSKLHYFGDAYGYNLTYSSLASIIKYPASSTEGNLGKGSAEIGKKKFGYFVTERDKYDSINLHLQLHNRRSPVVYLLEAADDIAYSAADIEDGVKLGTINLIDVKEIFESNLVDNKDVVLRELDKLQHLYSGKNIDDSVIIQKFRIFTQRIMIEEIIRSFQVNYEAIMNGTLEKEIIDISNASDIRRAYKKLQAKVFDEKSIVKKEIAGWEAIYGLLDIFVKASESENFKADGNTYESRIFRIISSSYRTVYQNFEPYHNDRYKRLQLVVDFISGMTDSYAINLFQELKGIKL